MAGSGSSGRVGCVLPQLYLLAWDTGHVTAWASPLEEDLATTITTVICHRRITGWRMVVPSGLGCSLPAGVSDRDAQMCSYQHPGVDTDTPTHTDSPPLHCVPGVRLVLCGTYRCPLHTPHPSARLLAHVLAHRGLLPPRAGSRAYEGSMALVSKCVYASGTCY